MGIFPEDLSTTSSLVKMRKRVFSQEVFPGGFGNGEDLLIITLRLVTLRQNPDPVFALVGEYLQILQLGETPWIRLRNPSNIGLLGLFLMLLWGLLRLKILPILRFRRWAEQIASNHLQGVPSIRSMA